MSKGLHLGGVALPDVDRDPFAHADIEIRRAHERAGLQRKHVEGAWAKVCRAAFRTRIPLLREHARVLRGDA